MSVLVLVLSAGVWGGYLFLQDRWVAQLYCGRQAEIQVALMYLKTLEERAAYDEFVAEMFKEEVVTSFHLSLAKLPAEFKPFAAHLPGPVNATLDGIEKSAIETASLSQRLHEPCVYALDWWLGAIAQWPTLPKPEKLVQWKNELKTWREKFVAIQSRLPIVKEQFAADQKIVCLAADNAKKAKETLTFYKAGCREGKKSCLAAQTKKLTGWLEEQESDLRLNTERFTIKWGPKRIENLKCLKDLHEMEQRASINPSGGRATNSVGR